MAKIIVIGGVAAGMSAAAQAKRCGGDNEVIVCEKGGHISYGACGLPYFVGNEKQEYTDLLALTPEKALVQKGVKAFTYREAARIDIARRNVTVKNLETGALSEEKYDSLIIATGACSYLPPVEGIGSKGVYTLRTLEDGIRLKQFINENKPNTAHIIGEGHIALEAAEVFRQRGVEHITLSVSGRHLCWWLDEDIAALIEEEAARNRVEILKTPAPKGISRVDGGMKISYADFTREAEFVFVSRGMKPNTALAEQAGIRLDKRGAIDVDNYCATSAEGVFAAGDCANVYNYVTKEKMYFPRGTIANRQGRAAGYNAAGVKTEYKGTCAPVVFKFFSIEAGRTGLTAAEAKRRGLDAESVLIKSVTKPGYYPGGSRIYVKLTCDRATGKLLGAQIAGGETSAKKIDLLSAALYNEMTIEELKNIDFAYAPPFSPVWDPVLTAAGRLSKIIKNR